MNPARLTSCRFRQLPAVFDKIFADFVQMLHELRKNCIENMRGYADMWKWRRR